MRDTEREEQRHRQREKQAPCREPEVGLNPGTPGSHPGPKASTKQLSHPGIPRAGNFKASCTSETGVIRTLNANQSSIFNDNIF